VLRFWCNSCEVKWIDPLYLFLYCELRLKDVVMILSSFWEIVIEKTGGYTSLSETTSENKSNVSGRDSIEIESTRQRDREFS
jgi:hypothetical protein